MKERSPIPRATYRIQLNRNFTFAQATAIVPYLSALGISHCYLSPCLKARAGSTHGYDIVDHNSLNPEIGSVEEFDRFVATVRAHGMGLILDVVPNHMGIMGGDNAWWLDVLENGESSIYASFFDIDWRPIKEELRGKVLVPVLYDHYGAVLESGHLKLAFRTDRGEFDICYFHHRFPIDPREYPRILNQCVESLSKQLGEQDPHLVEFQSLITAFGHLPERSEGENGRRAERNRDKEIHKRRLAELCERAPEFTASIHQVLKQVNGDPADPTSFEQLHELIKAQAFRLANWRVASDDINYRRFFDTNDLAGISVENPAVFEATHRLVLELVAAGRIDGLRIDHPDGLYDPAEYFDRLRRATASSARRSENTNGDSFYIVIEKILTGSERLPDGWPVAGTTGYEFSNLVNGLFVDAAHRRHMNRIYKNFTSTTMDVDDVAYRCRTLIVRVALVSELNVLATRLARIALSKRHTCDFTLNSIRDALTEIVASFPVYRTYVSSSGVSETDANYIRKAVADAKLRSPAEDTTVFDFIGRVLLTDIAQGYDDAYRRAVTSFAMKFQQFSSPVMAKGIEDTAFYRYNRLVSLNDVGSDLHGFGTTIAEFHRANQVRLRARPHTMLATSTHDSKRSEDVRARINVLSEMPGEWRLSLRKWREVNRVHKTEVNNAPTPSTNDEYLLYQTLVGAWPIDDFENDSETENFRARIENYMLKAIREAKQNTSWMNQNTAYERAVTSFVAALLARDRTNRFLDEFIPFQRRISRIGFWNSLSQTLLKLTSPGVPDTYQGNELWDFSLVDPDNRRPVDYALRQESFRTIRTPDYRFLRELLERPEDGRIKLHLVSKTLCTRQQWPELFERGEYLPLRAKGVKEDHLVAFARKFGEAQFFVVAPRLNARLLGGIEAPPLGESIWGDTRLLLPSRSPNHTNVLTGETLSLRGKPELQEIRISQLLSTFPVGLWISQ